MRLIPLIRVLSILSLGFAASTVIAQDVAKPAAAAPAKKVESKTPTLNRAQVEQLLAQSDKLVIVDVRRPDELTAIGGFPVYLSIQLSELENSAAWIPKDRKVVTVSNHASRAIKAANLLVAKGFNVVGNIGVQNYEAEGGKLTKIAPKAAANADANKTAAL